MWRKTTISQIWAIAEGILLPKQANSSGIGMFHPISLLNVEGKVFFSIIARHMTNFLLANGYVDISVQKVGIPGFAGCVEHASAIWKARHDARHEKWNLATAWLDLANSYGSVPHSLIPHAMKTYHIPKQIQMMVEMNYNTFQMQFTTEKFTTGWQRLEVGIPMGCKFSPILFVMAMNVIILAA